jgi:hypothetical protein
MKKNIHDYFYSKIDPVTTFRTILLFGRNTSTFKFAYCSALLKQNPKNEINLKDLSNDFLSELYNHYKLCKSQWTTGKNNLSEAFDNYELDGDWEKVIKYAEKNIFNYVLDAFHNVGGSSIEKKYILFENDKKSKKIILTDSINKVLENEKSINAIKEENQTRWMIVEEAWKNKISPNMLEYIDGEFYSISKIHERVNIRSAVNVLLPYQNENCFYCNKLLNKQAKSIDLDFPDVDHFIPWSLFNKLKIKDLNPNGVWNLVLGCMECNRGKNGKSDIPPAKVYFEKLLDRNLLFALEHSHSLHNTILLSLNAKNSTEISLKMINIYKHFEQLKPWSPSKLY